MKRKKNNNVIGNYLGASVGLSAGAAIASNFNNSSAIQSNINTGIANMSSGLPILGNIYGAAMVLNATKKINKKRGKK